MTNNKVYSKYKHTKTIKHFGDWVPVTVTAEIHSIGNQSPYFSVTVDGPDFCGCNHDLVKKHWPRVAPFTPWHLVSVDTGPMYYIANARYWAGFCGFRGGKENDPPNEEHLKSTIVYGMVDGDTDVDVMSLDDAALCKWLAERFPALMRAFDHDMGRLFGNGYRLTQARSV